jgi:hypothetical protein
MLVSSHRNSPMTDTNQKQLGNTLWSIADQLRGAMDADDFRDYMLSFLFLRYLSDNYETAAKKELGKDYPALPAEDRRVPLALWYVNNPDDIPAFEKQMRRKVHYVIQLPGRAILHPSRHRAAEVCRQCPACGMATAHRLRLALTWNFKHLMKARG